MQTVLTKLMLTQMKLYISKILQFSHLGGSYKINDMFTVNARVNNLFDEDFTTYKTTFTADANGDYTPSYRDDYNNSTNHAATG